MTLSKINFSKNYKTIRKIYIFHHQAPLWESMQEATVPEVYTKHQLMKPLQTVLDCIAIITLMNKVSLIPMGLT